MFDNQYCNKCGAKIEGGYCDCVAKSINEDKVNGVLYIRENNSMSLSCSAEVVIKDSLITQIRYKGMPRTKGDTWYSFISSKKVGDTFTKEHLNNMLNYHGVRNVKSTFTRR